MDLNELIKLVGAPGALFLLLVWQGVRFLRSMQDESLAQTTSQVNTNEALTKVFTESQLHTLKQSDLLVAAKDELIRAYQQISKYELRYTELKAQVDELVERVTEKDKRIESLEVQVDALQTSVNTFKEKIQVSDNERAALLSERRQLMDYIARLEAQIMTLRQRLEQLDTQTLRALSFEVETLDAKVTRHDASE